MPLLQQISTDQIIKLKSKNKYVANCNPLVLPIHVTEYWKKKSENKPPLPQILPSFPENQPRWM